MLSKPNSQSAIAKAETVARTLSLALALSGRRKLLDLLLLHRPRQQQQQQFVLVERLLLSLLSSLPLLGRCSALLCSLLLFAARCLEGVTNENQFQSNIRAARVVRSSLRSLVSSLLVHRLFKSLVITVIILAAFFADRRVHTLTHQTPTPSLNSHTHTRTY